MADKKNGKGNPSMKDQRNIKPATKKPIVVRKRSRIIRRQISEVSSVVIGAAGLVGMQLRVKGKSGARSVHGKGEVEIRSDILKAVRSLQNIEGANVADLCAAVMENTKTLSDLWRDNWACWELYDVSRRQRVDGSTHLKTLQREKGWPALASKEAKDNVQHLSELLEGESFDLVWDEMCWEFPEEVTLGQEIAAFIQRRMAYQDGPDYGEPKAALTEALKELETLKSFMAKNVKEMIKAEE
jgi:hypothetical protein